MRRKLIVRSQTWPLKRPFSISRGTRTETEVVYVEIRDGTHVGRGESVPCQRYGESPRGAKRDVESLRTRVEDGLNRAELQQSLSAGAARNALDCALWDLEAKQSGVRVWQRAGTGKPGPMTTALTVSLGKPEDMAAEAAAYGDCELLKLKLGSEAVVESVRAVRQVSPTARLIVDANEAWSLQQLRSWQKEFADLDVSLIEQPLRAGQDDGLGDFEHLIPLCADESCHTVHDILRLRSLYDFINIKLDKTGGLTAALAVKQEALRHDLGLMIGCMVGTSLAMAPAILLTDGAEFVDLDGPVLLQEDREPGVIAGPGRLRPAQAGLWG